MQLPQASRREERREDGKVIGWRGRGWAGDHDTFFPGEGSPTPSTDDPSPILAEGRCLLPGSLPPAPPTCPVAHQVQEEGGGEGVVPRAMGSG